MQRKNEFVGKRLLLMGSKAFKADRLPAEIAEKIDEAVSRNMTILVGEALDACRIFQDYLKSVGYKNVVVGHAKSMRYNAGNWETRKYGEDLKHRERGMTKDCDSAIVIWIDNSGVSLKTLSFSRTWASRLSSMNAQQGQVSKKQAGLIQKEPTTLTMK